MTLASEMHLPQRTAELREHKVGVDLDGNARAEIERHGMFLFLLGLLTGLFRAAQSHGD